MIATLNRLRHDKLLNRETMFRITRAANGEVIFALSGRMDAEHMAELKTLFRSEPAGRRIILDLKELTLVDQDAVRFLDCCEARNIQLKNCPAYIREWITKERSQD
jgi:hypothetical protein